MITILTLIKTPEVTSELKPVWYFHSCRLVTPVQIPLKLVSGVDQMIFQCDVSSSSTTSSYHMVVSFSMNILIIRSHNQHLCIYTRFPQVLLMGVPYFSGCPLKYHVNTQTSTSHKYMIQSNIKAIYNVIS